MDFMSISGELCAQKSFIMKDKTGIFNTDSLNVVFIQFNSIEKNGTKIPTTPGNATLKHSVGRQNYGAQSSVTYWCPR